jgi:hypothetical protein
MSNLLLFSRLFNCLLKVAGIKASDNRPKDCGGNTCGVTPASTGHTLSFYVYLVIEKLKFDEDEIYLIDSRLH